MAERFFLYEWLRYIGNLQGQSILLSDASAEL
jgi:hypothetical protein